MPKTPNSNRMPAKGEVCEDCPGARLFATIVRAAGLDVRIPTIEERTPLSLGQIIHMEENGEPIVTAPNSLASYPMPDLGQPQEAMQVYCPRNGKGPSWLKGCQVVVCRVPATK